MTNIQNRSWSRNLDRVFQKIQKDTSFGDNLSVDLFSQERGDAQAKLLLSEAHT